MLMFPNPEMPYEVAATAWTQLMGCKTYEGATTLDAIRDFRDTYRGRGPEPLPITVRAEISGRTAGAIRLQMPPRWADG